MNKLLISPSPHVHSGDSIEKNMYGVLIALIPAFICSVLFFGMGAIIVTLTSVIENPANKYTLVDFWASWCGPCKALAPVLEELAAEYGDSIYIYKVNTEEEQELAAAFGIRSIPTLLFIPMEGKPQMAQGALPKASLKEAIDKVMLGK